VSRRLSEAAQDRDDSVPADKYGCLLNRDALVELLDCERVPIITGILSDTKYSTRWWQR